MYTIYKFTTPYNNFEVGDDIISSGYPVAATAGAVVTVSGEAYGGGYKGEIVQVPYSVLSIIATNVDDNSLSTYINYGSLPTPETNAFYMQNGYMPTCQPIATTSTSQSNTTTSTTSASVTRKNNSMVQTVLFASIGVAVIYGILKMSKKAE